MQTMCSSVCVDVCSQSSLIHNTSLLQMQCRIKVISPQEMPQDPYHCAAALRVFNSTCMTQAGQLRLFKDTHYGLCHAVQVASSIRNPHCRCSIE